MQRLKLLGFVALSRAQVSGFWTACGSMFGENWAVGLSGIASRVHASGKNRFESKRDSLLYSMAYRRPTCSLNCSSFFG